MKAQKESDSGKKAFNKKKATGIILLVAAALILLSTWAWFTFQKQVKNVFMMGVTSVDLVDELPNPAITPGQTLEKNVSVVNNGDADMLIRVRFDEKLNTKKLSGGNVVQYGTLLQANLPSTTIVPIKDSVKAQYESAPWSPLTISGDLLNNLNLIVNGKTLNINDGLSSKLKLFSNGSTIAGYYINGGINEEIRVTETYIGPLVPTVYTVTYAYSQDGTNVQGYLAQNAPASITAGQSNNTAFGSDQIKFIPGTGNGNTPEASTASSTPFHYPASHATYGFSAAAPSDNTMTGCFSKFNFATPANIKTLSTTAAVAPNTWYYDSTTGWFYYGAKLTGGQTADLLSSISFAKNLPLSVTGSTYTVTPYMEAIQADKDAVAVTHNDYAEGSLDANFGGWGFTPDKTSASDAKAKLFGTILGV
ncbi:hypothetical protein [Eubacterium callanderi]|uniref:hypothetical protein n=1 Tax=Eubacterium callanderi TaxID=53442 RepID=UPI002672D269|nr:hypothetical protein [Eubacterium callanderi]